MGLLEFCADSLHVEVVSKDVGGQFPERAHGFYSSKLFIFSLENRRERARECVG